MSLNTNEQLLASNADADTRYPDADPDASVFDYRLC